MLLNQRKPLWLQEADLSDANPGKGDLRRANLSKADLHGADLRGAKYDSDTVWLQGFIPPADGRYVE